MQAIELDDTLRERQQAGRMYFEFLRVPALSAGVYVLPAGGTDPQQPHTEDELYYVASGAASIEVDGESRPVRAGSRILRSRPRAAPLPLDHRRAAHPRLLRPRRIHPGAAGLIGVCAGLSSMP